MRKISEVMRAHGRHWVGNGFPVRTLFSYGGDSAAVSPFLLFDYAGPHVFEPSTAPRGAGQHPHRGFETVTIVYDGEVAHRDSTGKGGVIGPGDVPWMTAARQIHILDGTRIPRPSKKSDDQDRRPTGCRECPLMARLL